MEGNLYVTVVLVLFCLLDGFVVVRNYLHVRNRRFTDIYCCGYEGVMKGVACLTCGFIVMSLIQYTFQYSSDINILYSYILLLIPFSFYFIYKIVARVRVCEEGILLPRKTFIPYRTLKRVDIKPAAFGKYYVVTLKSKAKRTEKLVIRMDEMDAFIGIINDYSTAHVWGGRWSTIDRI
ncbi:MAG: hypothetical protein RSC49_00660 [Clostridium sp.]